MTVVRSPHAHDRIRSIDITEATSAPGVVAVLTAADFHRVVSGVMRVAPAFVPEKKQTGDRFPIADGEVCYQGEPVAVVIAETGYQAADAADLIQVDWEALPAVMDLDRAMEAGSQTVHAGAPGNIGSDKTLSPGPEAALAEAQAGPDAPIPPQRLPATPRAPP